VTEPYAGPPPTRRPEPWQAAPLLPGPGWAGPPWGAPPPGGPYGAPPPAWGAPPPWGGPPPWGVPAALPPGLHWEPPAGTPPHDEPQPFLRAMRSRTWAWWRPVAGLVLAAFVWLAGATAVLLASLVTGVAPDLALLDLVDPWVLLITNITLILFVPAVWLAWAVAHGMSIGWSASVLARIRPRLLLPYTFMALGTIGVGILLSVGFGAAVGADGVTGPVPDLAWLLLVVFLTTPLQSAAEEYLFRGYLSQAIAGWLRDHRAGAVVAGLVTATLFSLAHAPPDFLTFLDRFVFALAASATVWLTGGLEAAVVLHAVNNVLVFTLAGLLGEAVATAEVPDGTGIVFVLISIASMSGYVALVARSRQRLRPETRTAAQDLRSVPGPPPPPGGAWSPVPAPVR
jgi:membrane protease YdiL (CAAX protease family)